MRTMALRKFSMEWVSRVTIGVSFLVLSMAKKSGRESFPPPVAGADHLPLDYHGYGVASGKDSSCRSRIQPGPRQIRCDALYRSRTSCMENLPGPEGFSRWSVPSHRHFPHRSGSSTPPPGEEKTETFPNCYTTTVSRRMGNNVRRRRHDRRWIRAEKKRPDRGPV